jgi:VWFA-related protein
LYNADPGEQFRMRHTFKQLAFVFVVAIVVGVVGGQMIGQTQSQNSSVADGSSPARPVTIPLTIRVKGITPEPELRMVDLTVSEDGEPQSILSVRAIGNNSPITLALLVQDDVVPSIANEIRGLRQFVLSLPRGSRVLIGYIRAGSLQVRQKFSTDLEKASAALRTPLGTASAAPYNPYVEVIEALRRFDSQPSGRRAILMISDGLDTSRGIDSSSATQSLDLQRAVAESQRRGVAVYAFYAPTVSSTVSSTLAANAQSSLQRLADETGGQAFFQGTGVPVTFDPFIKNLTVALERQVALTYLSTHLNKGFHRVEVHSSAPGVELAYPAGYSRK